MNIREAWDLRYEILAELVMCAICAGLVLL